jgi:hypothetical protein
MQCPKHLFGEERAPTAQSASPRTGAGNMIVLNASWKATLDAQPTSSWPDLADGKLAGLSVGISTHIFEAGRDDKDWEWGGRLGILRASWRGAGDSEWCRRLRLLWEIRNAAGNSECCESVRETRNAARDFQCTRRGGACCPRPQRLSPHLRGLVPGTWWY